MYPRQCIKCQSTYKNKQTYHQHKKFNRCLGSSTTTTNAPQNIHNGPTYMITNNIVANNVTNVSNVSELKDLEGLLESGVHSGTKLARVSDKERVELKQLQDLFKSHGIQDLASLTKALETFEKSWREIIYYHFSYHNHTYKHVDIVNCAIDKCNIPLKEDKRMVTYVDMSPRDLMLSLTKEIWLLMFLPTLNAKCDNENPHGIKDLPFDRTHILAHLIRRPIRVDKDTKDQCQVRQKDDTDVSYQWTRQDWSEVITPSFLAIHSTLAKTISEQRDNIESIVVIALHDFLLERRKVYIPEKIMQDIITAIIKDSKDHLVGGWRTFIDSYHDEQRFMLKHQIETHDTQIAHNTIGGTTPQ